MFAYNPKGLSSIPNMQVKSMGQFTPIISAPGKRVPEGSSQSGKMGELQVQ